MTSPFLACPPAPFARAFGLLVATMVFSDVFPTFVLDGALPAGRIWETLRQATFLVLFVHIGVTLYDGCFDRPRRLTWLLLIGVGVTTEIGGFLGYVLPWGQMSFWLASRLIEAQQQIPLLGDGVVTWLWQSAMRTSSPISAATLLTLALVLDLALLHRPRGPHGVRRYLQIVAGGVVLALAARGLWDAFGIRNGALQPDPAAIPSRILPLWYEWPLYALLRSVPDKATGVAVMISAMMLPMMWPWVGAARLRTGSSRLLFQALYAVGLAALLALFWAGAQSADEALVRSRLAGCCYLLFFCLVPVLARGSGRSVRS